MSSSITTWVLSSNGDGIFASPSHDEIENVTPFALASSITSHRVKKRGDDHAIAAVCRVLASCILTLGPSY